MNQEKDVPAIWFPAIRAGTGADVFTQRLRDGLVSRGIRAEITWLPHHAEYLPWAILPRRPPQWANVVHVNTWLHARFVPKHLAVLATVHHSVHDPALMPYKSVMQSCYHRLWVRRLERRLLCRARRVVAVSEYTSKKVQEEFGAQRVQVIYNGVTIPKGIEGVARRALSSTFRILYVGSWSRRKGVDLLGPIMRGLGDGYELAYTQSGRGGAGQEGLPPNCYPLGRLSRQQLERAYRESDVLIFPSRLEGFGLVAAEAMSYGLPVVASDSSALPEVVEHGKTGLLCATNDIDGFIDAIRILSGSTDLRTAMAVAAKERARRLFAEGDAVDAYIECYRSLLSSSNEDLIHAETA